MSNLNFARHLKRSHSKEREVNSIFSDPNKTKKEVRQLITLIRNQGNLDSALLGFVIPKKKTKDAADVDHEICRYCNGFYHKKSLTRHLQSCFAKPQNEQPETVTSCVVYRMSLKKYCEYLNKLTVTKAIFKKLKPDLITETSIGDPLVAEFAERLFRSKKTNRCLYVINNRIRECGRFMIELKKLIDVPDMLSILKGKNYDYCLDAVRMMAGFDPERRAFKAPSLALHFGTTLENLSSLAKSLIFRNKFPTHAVITDKDKERDLLAVQYITALENFRALVKDQWHGDIGKLALKDLEENKAKKPKLIPLTDDVVKLKNYLETESADAYEKLRNCITKEQYCRLAETALAYTIMFNRKRPGDVQFLELEMYHDQISREQDTSSHEFESSLSESEKILVSQCRRVVSMCKGTRQVPILLPKKLQKYYARLYEIRTNSIWFKQDNHFFSLCPEVTDI